MQDTIVTIVPAEAGLHTLYEFDEGEPFEICEAIVAWRIETERTKDGGYTSMPYAITCDGPAGTNCIGMVHATGRVTIWDASSYASLDAFKKARAQARNAG